MRGDLKREDFLAFLGETRQKSDQSTFNSHDDVIVGNGSLQEILTLLDLAASVHSPVLITGETGTGKNLLAKTIHFKSQLRNAPFVALNCAALPENLIESELFGIEKGAFTGAVSSRKGIIELAEGGTMFLDEIGEIPLNVQSKFLDVVEEKRIRRIGGNEFRCVRFRLISSTSVPLETVLGSSFRRDLYYRLNVLRIHLPPLRNRREDIPELCQYFLKQLGFNPSSELPASEIEQLQNYDWPGNIRELRNVLESAFLRGRGETIRPSELLGSAELTKPQMSSWDGTERRSSTYDRRKNQPLDFERPDQSMNTSTLIETEKQCIQNTLKSMNGNFSRTAKHLGISLSTLKRKLKTYGMKVLAASFSSAVYLDSYLPL